MYRNILLVILTFLLNVVVEAMPYDETDFPLKIHN